MVQFHFGLGGDGDDTTTRATQNGASGVSPQGQNTGVPTPPPVAKELVQNESVQIPAPEVPKSIPVTPAVNPFSVPLPKIEGPAPTPAPTPAPFVKPAMTMAPIPTPAPTIKPPAMTMAPVKMTPVPTPAPTQTPKKIEGTPPMTPKAPEAVKTVPPVVGGSDDPLAAAKTLKSQIQSYVQRHKDNIQKYQDQIKDTEAKIQQEKDALRKKQEEFSALVREMGELTSCFNGGSENKNQAPKGGKKR